MVITMLLISIFVANKSWYQENKISFFFLVHKKKVLTVVEQCIHLLRCIFTMVMIDFILFFILEYMFSSKQYDCVSWTRGEEACHVRRLFTLSFVFLLPIHIKLTTLFQPT